MSKIECQFELKRGKLLRDVVNQDVSKNMTQFNISNELALYHLKTNPGCCNFFSQLPEDLDAQLEGFSVEATTSADSNDAGDQEAPIAPEKPKARARKRAEDK